MTKPIRIHYLAALFIMIVCSAGCSKEPLPSVPALPEQLGRLTLSSTVRGVPANKFIYKMHGKLIGSTANIIGYYGKEGSDNVLYISCFEHKDSAQKALELMLTKMVGSQAGFTPVEEDRLNGKVFFKTTGMGLSHFFYRTANLVVWWQVVPHKARETFEMLHQYPFDNQDTEE